MDLRELQRQAHENARAKGFHDVRLSIETHNTIRTLSKWLACVTDGVENLRRRQPAACVLLDTQHWIINPPPNATLSHNSPEIRASIRRLLLVATEVTEAIRAIGTPEYASELADIVIRVADTAAADGVDLQAAVEEKMKLNAARPRMHGGKVF